MNTTLRLLLALSVGALFLTSFFGCVDPGADDDDDTGIADDDDDVVGDDDDDTTTGPGLGLLILDVPEDMDGTSITITPEDETRQSYTCTTECEMVVEAGTYIVSGELPNAVFCDSYPIEVVAGETAGYTLAGAFIPTDGNFYEYDNPDGDGDPLDENPVEIRPYNADTSTCGTPGMRIPSVTSTTGVFANFGTIFESTSSRYHGEVLQNLTRVSILVDVTNPDYVPRHFILQQ